MVKPWLPFLKLYRSARLWGWKRALVKTAGRGRLRFLRRVWAAKPDAHPGVSVIGCGQAAFATLCYYIRQHQGGVFLDCYDLQPAQAQALGQFYHFKAITPTATAVLQNPALQTLYVASNHASHTDYAVEGLRREITVFVEKPLCTTADQLMRLRAAIQTGPGRLYAGYNRPFAPAIEWLRYRIQDQHRPFTLHAVVHGHLLDPDHWYRLPEEGTRIAGNMSHWIDLAVHLMHCRGRVPGRFELLLQGPGTSVPKDDNAVLVLTTDMGDLVSISINARHEPFDGIREVLEYQDTTLAVQIDDFRKLRWWEGSRQGTIRYAQKDVGHEACTLQPFATKGLQRSWPELELTTALTLEAVALARAGGGAATFNTSSLALGT